MYPKPLLATFDVREHWLPDRIYLGRSPQGQCGEMIDDGKTEVLDELDRVLSKISNKVSGGGRYFQIL